MAQHAALCDQAADSKFGILDIVVGIGQPSVDWKQAIILLQGRVVISVELGHLVEGVGEGVMRGGTEHVDSGRRVVGVRNPTRPMQRVLDATVTDAGDERLGQWICSQ